MGAALLSSTSWTSLSHARFLLRGLPCPEFDETVWPALSLSVVLLWDTSDFLALWLLALLGVNVSQMR